MKLCFPERVLDQHLVVLGKTGAGKSSALRHVVEHLLSQKKRVCIVDPKGDWWGLKSSADGESAGYPVIAFGDFKEAQASDIPITPQSGKHIAELITGGNRPCIIGFRGWMPGQMTDFWLDFAPALFNSSEGELYIVIDEVHNFAPKGKILDPKAGKVIHWTNRLLSEGRGLGLVFLIASQRPQKVHNDTLTCCETLVAMRVNHAADRGAIKDWIDGCGDKEHGAEVLNTVASMARGEAFVWSPEIGFGPERLKFPMFKTFDSFAPPQLQKKISESGWSEVNLDAVKEKLAAVIEEAKANDPAELKKKIAHLNAELRKKQPAAPSVDPALRAQAVTLRELRDTLGAAMKIIATINALGFDAPVDPEQIKKAVEAASAQIVKAAEASLQARVAELEQLKREAARIARKAEALLDGKETEIALRVDVNRNQPFTVQARQPSRRIATNGNGDGSLAGPEQRILSAIAWLNTIGVEEPEQTAVAFLAGYTYGGGAFNNPRGSLNTKGLVQYLAGERIRLTDEGRALAETPDAPLDANELQRLVLERLPGPERKILSVLIDAYPNPLPKDECAEKAGYAPEGGAFNNPCGRLRSLGLIDYPERGQAAAKSLLFLE